MILPLLGLGAIAIAAMALSRPSGAPSATPAPTPAGAPPALPPPAEAAQRVREGNPTSEDYESLAREAERQGVNDAAAQLRERATEVPSQSEVRDALPPGYTQVDPGASSALPSPYPAAPTPVPAPPEQAHEAEEAASDPSVPDPEADQIPAPSPEPEAAPDDSDNPAPGFTPPAGFNPVQARSLAASVARDIVSRQYSYNRANLRAFQTAAGIAADGIYGRESRGALAFYGVQNPPRVLFGSASDMAYPEALAWHAERIERGAVSGSIFDPPPYVGGDELAWSGFESEVSPEEAAELIQNAGYTEVGFATIVGDKARRRRVLGAIFGGPIGALAAIRARRRAKAKAKARAAR